MVAGSRRVRHWWCDDSGALTVDWVVLTAATIGLGALVLTQVRNDGLGLSRAISSTLSSVAVAQLWPSEPEYAIQRLTSQQLEQWTETFSAQTNAELQASAQQRFDQFTTHLEAEQWTQAQTRMDYYHLIQQEMASRGLSAPAGLPSAADLHQTYNEARA